MGILEAILLYFLGMQNTESENNGNENDGSAGAIHQNLDLAIKDNSLARKAIWASIILAFIFLAGSFLCFQINRTYVVANPKFVAMLGNYLLIAGAVTYLLSRVAGYLHKNRIRRRT